MNLLNLPVLSPPGFTVTPEISDRILTLRFRGDADMSTFKVLDDYLGVVHVGALSHGVTIVVVDFLGLEFMNSSCFKCFVTWLGKVQDLPMVSRYRVVFDANRELHWQRRSLNALRSFAMDVVSVETR